MSLPPPPPNPEPRQVSPEIVYCLVRFLSNFPNPGSEREFPVLLMPTPNKKTNLFFALTRENTQKENQKRKNTPKKHKNTEKHQKNTKKKIALTREKKPLASKKNLFPIPPKTE